MEYSRRELVRMGPLKVSPMGLGTWAWGNQLLWGYEEGMDAELQELFNLVSVERAHGHRYVVLTTLTFRDDSSTGTTTSDASAETQKIYEGCAASLCGKHSSVVLMVKDNSQCTAVAERVLLRCPHIRVTQ